MLPFFSETTKYKIYCESIARQESKCLRAREKKMNKRRNGSVTSSWKSFHLLRYWKIDPFYCLRVGLQFISKANAYEKENCALSSTVNNFIKNVQYFCHPRIL